MIVRKGARPYVKKFLTPGFCIFSFVHISLTERPNFTEQSLFNTLTGLIFARLNFASLKIREIFWIYFREQAILKISRGLIFANSVFRKLPVGLFS